MESGKIQASVRIALMEVAGWFSDFVAPIRWPWRRSQIKGLNSCGARRRKGPDLKALDLSPIQNLWDVLEKRCWRELIHVLIVLAFGQISGVTSSLKSCIQ